MATSSTNDNVLGPTTTSPTPPPLADDPKIPPPEPFENPDPDDPDSTRDAKRRRRTCLKGLEKVEELLIAPHNSNPGFGFTFDTKSVGSSPDVTPKFGSFNFEVPCSEKNQNSDEDEDEDEEEEKKETADVAEERREEDGLERSEINGSSESVEGEAHNKVE